MAQRTSGTSRRDGSRDSRAGRSRRGFTFVEVFVAIALFAVLLGALYEVFYSATRLNRDTQGRADALQSATLALATVQADLRRLVTTPVERDAQGRIKNRFGDHQVPVWISPGGKHLSFYVPSSDPGRQDRATRDAETVTYSLEPAPVGGLYRLCRRLGAAEGEPASEVGEVGGIQLRALEFKLREPKADDAELKSPDESYYLETTVTGADSDGRESFTLRNLARLDFPANHNVTASRNLNEEIRYQPRSPLTKPVEKPNYTREDAATLDKLRDLAERCEKGELPAPQLEQAVAEELNRLAGRPGKNPVLVNPGKATLPPVASVRALPPQPGRPVEVETDGGDRVLLPTSPGPLRDRLREEAARGNGSGNVGFVMTVTERRYVNGQLVSSRSHDSGGSIGYNWNNPADYDSVHTAAKDESQRQISTFFRRYGLDSPFTNAQ
ncbi:MAG: prepilin-type N-terminal cleavage/methylation domain-containing protein [Candidatus Wallbacteria bacterium]|nr:prepilin-type N-terminal cleavage/methylation domain-containing protein [Candidatus Wallbacteria bacterium]